MLQCVVVKYFVQVLRSRFLVSRHFNRFAECYFQVKKPNDSDSTCPFCQRVKFRAVCRPLQREQRMKEYEVTIAQNLYPTASEQFYSRKQKRPKKPNVAFDRNQMHRPKSSV